MAGDIAHAIDIGCKDNPLAVISVDIDFQVNPKIVASVLNLPIKMESFKKCFFLETLEHLPINTELFALKEINRILKQKGILILTTPHDTWIHTYLDPAYWLQGHRHYKKQRVFDFLIKAGFQVEHISVRGGCLHLLKSLYYYLITKILGIAAPSWLLKKADKEYNFINPNGASIIVKAVKIKSI